MIPAPSFEQLESLDAEGLRTMFIGAWWAGDMLALRLADFAAGFARVDSAAASRALVELRLLVRRDPAAQRKKMLKSTGFAGVIDAIEGRVGDALDGAEHAIAEAAKPGH
jgi:hypothetical protein